MALKKSNISEDLYNLLTQKGFDIKCLNAEGNQDVDIKDADIFSFDYEDKDTGTNYGPVTLNLSDDLALEVLVPDTLGKHLEDEQARDGWFDFLHDLRQFCRQHGCNFDLQNIGHLPYRLKRNQNELAKQRMMESWAGRGKTYSESQGPQATRLRIQHTRPLGEQDQRFRHVARLFVETAEGERFALPFKNLAGGRAMAMHISEGGRPWDEQGLHIIEMVKEATVLSNFVRGSHLNTLSEGSGEIAERARNRALALRRHIKSLSGRKGYRHYFESWTGQEEVINEDLVTEIKGMFTQPKVDPRVEAAAPYLARMKEVAVFEHYLDSLSEGTWAVPDSNKDDEELVAMFEKPIRLGPEGEDAQGKIGDILGDDQLFDELHSAAESDPEGDARPVIMRWMEMHGSAHPQIEQLYSKLNNNVSINTDREGVNAPEVKDQAGEPPHEPDEVETLQQLAGAKPAMTRPNPRGE